MEKTPSIQIKDFDNFQSACNHFGIEVNNNQLKLFKKYNEILLDWNKKINLISRKEERILEKHFLDSILFLTEIEGLINQTPTNVFDIGSGGGFPAIPLAIMKPEWDFTLCESVKKKATYLVLVIKELGLEKQINVINDRVEVIHKLPLHKNKYDFVTARALAKLDILIKYALPLLKPKGFLLAYKAKEIDCEIKGVKDVFDQIKKSQKIIKNNDLELKIFTKEVNGVERKLVAVQSM